MGYLKEYHFKKKANAEKKRKQLAKEYDFVRMGRLVSTGKYVVMHGRDKKR